MNSDVAAEFGLLFVKRVTRAGTDGTKFPCGGTMFPP